LSDSKQIFDVEITTRCNKRCYSCPRLNFARPNRDMSSDTFEALCAWLPRGSDVFFAGYGEPLLHDSLPDFIGKLFTKEIKASVMTNGKLLSRDGIRELFEHGLHKLQISILLKDGTQEMMKFVDIIGSEFYAKTQFNLMYDESTGKAEHLTESLERLGFKVSYKRIHSRGGHLYRNAEKANPSPCGTFLYVTYIDTDGGLQICSNDINGEYNLGNIATLTFEQLFEKKRLNGDKVIAPICELCDDEYRLLNMRKLEETL